ncbi:hypothetical protein J6E39_03205 [bacterium]|nr:hypothetical protein [bacterium]
MSYGKILSRIFSKGASKVVPPKVPPLQLKELPTKAELLAKKVDIEKCKIDLPESVIAKFAKKRPNVDIAEFKGKVPAAFSEEMAKCTKNLSEIELKLAELKKLKQPNFTDFIKIPEKIKIDLKDIKRAKV